MTEGNNIRLLCVAGPSSNRHDLPERLAAAGYEVTLVDDPGSALALLRKKPDSFDAVLSGVSNDAAAGLDFLTALESEPAVWNKPVIMQTGRGAEERRAALVEAGAHFCINQDTDDEMLRSVVQASAIDGRRTDGNREQVRERPSEIGRILAGTFEIHTLEQARALATMLSLSCPDPQSTAIGLTELMTNAIEHGNLGITYDEKTRLLKSDSWIQEVERRLALPENRRKSVIIEFEQEDDAFCFRIKDQGAGFDPDPFLQIDPARSRHTHGRGITVASQFCFDRIEYVGCGNEVVATISTRTRNAPDPGARP